MITRLGRLFAQRRAGVLLHPSSLPSCFSSGDIGTEAKHYIDFLASCGFRVWQMLPIGPTHSDGSPYQLLSVHAGNPDLIDPHWLQERDWVRETELLECSKRAVLRLGAERFADACAARPEEPLALKFRSFCLANSHWLDDYALYMALREASAGQAWQQWPVGVRQRQADALAAAVQEHALTIAAVKFEQFVFFEQWQELREHARDKGIALFGDMPIFVHLDSADVWANPGEFRLDENGQPLVVTGVPPDYFSADGQRWGNPHYDWQRMEAEGFAWWIQRVASQQKLFDLIRVDHFRGFQACWEIPVQAPTAIDGKWVTAPGKELFKAISGACGDVPFVAENLGIITPEVEELRHAFGLPGMLILQFAFDGSPKNPYLPHNHRSLEVVYTGTHDNDTTLGWYEGLDTATRQRVHQYFGNPTEEMPGLLIRGALASVAGLAILPMQDLLGLGSEHRMNVPGTTSGNWRWRFNWGDIEADLPARMLDLLGQYDRLPDDSGLV